MTCICGIEHKGTVWLAGDSAATDQSLNRTIIKDPKVFVRGEIAFGVCGLPKVMDALAHVIKLPTQVEDSDRAFLVGELVPAIRDGLRKLDCTHTTPEEGTYFEGAMLIGYRGKLYELQGNFQLIHSSDGWAAVGSGEALAKGSFRTTAHIKDPEKRLLTVLEAACDNAGVAPPFTIVKVKSSKRL
jgi:ATP-dependent protease HslVU (ClpYQ) peptidase subunit